MNEQQGPTKKKRSPLLIGCLGVFGLFVLLAIIGAIVGPPPAATGNATADAGSTSADTPAAPSARAVTSTELARAFEKNEVAAQREYGDQTLAVTGKVLAIELDALDNPVVRLEGGNPYIGVSVHLDKDQSDQAAQLSAGQTITATCGKVSEVISAPQLTDCTL